MIKKATIADVRELHKFLIEAAKEGEILPRSMNDLYQYVRDYWVYRPGKGAPIKAATGLHICWEDLAEVRNLFVSNELRGKGLGEKLVGLCLEEAKSLGVHKLFALTYRAGFFYRLGFKPYDRGDLPNKVWVDCLQCMKFPDCDEEAVIFDIERDAFTLCKKPARRKRKRK